MFIGTEIQLDVRFGAARARLARLARGGVLRRASDDAYRNLGAGLARVGPLEAVPGLSRLVAVRFSDMTIHEDFASVAMRWEADGPGGALFPALDADITLSPAGDDATKLMVAGVYRPPFGALGAGLDRVLLHRVAEATIRVFAQDIAAAMADPALSPAVRPEPCSRADPGTP
ncbi:MAG TPA: hypothetical protein VK284_00520 [Streptosporangiaceae bacterium]|nr:hypothetical protein [Streptosporangiaceae bacterium]HLN67504.1 hypothetical protein [Streptosporangiaceae bacterium]